MKKLSNFFALRYLFSKKSHSLINVISIISSFSIAIPVAALIVLFAIFGGLVSFVEQLNTAFDPEIRVSRVDERYFDSDSLYKKIIAVEGVEFASSYIEDNGLAQYNSAQSLVRVRGVDSLYNKTVPIEKMIRAGRYELEFGSLDNAIVGAGVAYNLGVRLASATPIMIYAPTSQRRTFLPSSAFNQKRAFPSAVFTIDAETDGNYIIVPKRMAERLFNKVGMVSAFSIKSKEGVNIDKVQQRIEKAIGSDFKAENRQQQKETVYKLMEGEKRVIFIISMLVMVIASFTLVGSLIMLMTDKKAQIETMKVLGATQKFIELVFIKQGLLISSISIGFGTILGVTMVLIQQWSGVIKINSQTLLVDAYPVLFSWSDLFSVVVSVGVINIIIIFVTVKAQRKRKN